MPRPGLFFNILQMDTENYQPLPAKGWGDDESASRQRCGCLRTSEKLRQLLDTSFPSAPPPTPATTKQSDTIAADVLKQHMDDPECISAYCKHLYHPIPVYPTSELFAMVQHADKYPNNNFAPATKPSSKGTRLVKELAKLLLLAVTATALAVYYLLYCYMQLIYFVLRTAVYFHNADGPMKITIAVVSMTSVVVAFNLLLRLQKTIGNYC